ncbi:MAG: hypothetical protein HYW70_03535 [Candidatus Nealsonbacteria bacterium]|nr:hypothetical protein [Candidatus Nealsonbacteria bacterium]
MEFSLDPLPEGFVFYKPLQREAYDESTIFELEKKRKLIITRKRDGWKLIAVKSGKGWKVYTDSTREVTERLPHIKKELDNLEIPENSMLIGEGIVDLDGNDNFLGVGSVFNSKPQKSLEMQRQNGLVKFMVFDIAFWEGRCSLSQPYSSRLENIQRVLAKGKPGYVMPLTVVDAAFNEAKNMVRNSGWEGLVLYDKDFTASIRLDGKSPKRPEGCYKWKPVFEDDFIVREWIPQDKDPAKLKEVVLLQIDPVTKKEFDCGRLGSFSGETRRKIKEILEGGTGPAVLQVGFEIRFSSGKLRNKWFIRIREDKSWRNCLAPKSFTN